MATSTHRWGEAETAELIRLHRTVGVLGQIADTMGWSKAVVSREAKKAGLSWDRSQTAGATQARAADNKTRRAAILARMYTRSEFILDRLEAEQFTTLVPTAPGVQSERTFAFVPTIDEKALAASLSSYSTMTERIEKTDNDAGVTEAKSLLERLADRLDVHGPTS